MQNKEEKQLAVEEELRNVRLQGDAVKKRQLAVEQELTVMRSERDAANERVDRLATEMRNFQEHFLGNRSTMAPPPLPSGLGPRSEQAAPTLARNFTF